MSREYRREEIQDLAEQYFEMMRDHHRKENPGPNPDESGLVNIDDLDIWDRIEFIETLSDSTLAYAASGKMGPLSRETIDDYEDAIATVRHLDTLRAGLITHAKEQQEIMGNEPQHEDETQAG